MPACPVCAYDNPGSATECANCGADLRTDVPAATPVGGLTPLQESASAQGTAPYTTSGSGRASPDPAGTVRERPPGGGRTPSDNGTPRGRPGRRGADLSLEPAELQVDPGSAGTVTVTVHNLGAEVERFTLEVNGPGGAFATPTPRDLRMLPDRKESAVLRFTPARDPAQRAGSQPFQVVARSTVNPDVVERAAGVVTVGGFDQLDADLVPEVTRGRRKPGTHRLELVNTGNQPAAVAVELCDDSGELTFDPATAEVRLEPGEREELPIQVSAPYPWFGRTQSYPFTAEVTATGVPQPARLTGVRRQVPRFPWWVPTASLALAGVAIALYALFGGKTVPNVVGRDESTAVSMIEEADFQAVPIRQPNTSFDEGQVFDTVPKAEQRSRGESVSLFVSQGPCPEPCPVPVPSVVGLPVDEAVAHMARAGLVPRQAEQASAEVESGRVVGTDPVAGTPLPREEPVAVLVSTGAPPSTEPSPTGPSPTGPSSTGPSSTAPSTGAPASSPQPGGNMGEGGARTSAGGPLEMPDLTGRPLAEAQAEVQALDADLSTAVATVRTDEADPGAVVTTVPAPGRTVQRGAAVTITVAAPAVVDLLEAAGEAVWRTDTAELEFPTAAEDGPPAARVVEEALLEDERTGRVLLTEPTADGMVTAEIPIEGGILPGDRLLAQVGFLQGAGGSAEFVVRVDGRTVRTEADMAGDGELQPIDVELGDAVGATSVVITVTARAGTAEGPHQAVWRDLRIEGLTK